VVGGSSARNIGCRGIRSKIYIGSKSFLRQYNGCSDDIITHSLTTLLTNFRSSSSRVRASLKDPSLRGGLNRLKNNPGSCRENACASATDTHMSLPQDNLD
jgi:hypothetical protein